MRSHQTPRRDFLVKGSGLLALGCMPGPRLARAQGAGALRMLCTGPAGSVPDIVARRYAEQLASRYPGGVFVDNRPGAAGRIAVAALKQSDGDGATMLLAQGAIATVYPYLYEKLGYEVATDLKPVSVAAEATLGLAVGPAVPASVSNLRELIDWTRAHPKRANYGSPGAGTLPHLLSALLAVTAQVDWQHVAYAGGPQALVDLVGGRIAVLILPEGLLRQHHAAGRLRVLATSGSIRSEFMPSVATFAEQGYASLVMREWFGLFMPGSAPQAVADSAAGQVRLAAASPGVSQALRDNAMVAVAGTAAQMGERIVVEQAYWQRVLGATSIRAE